MGAYVVCRNREDGFPEGAPVPRRTQDIEIYVKHADTPYHRAEDNWELIFRSAALVQVVESRSSGPAAWERVAMKAVKWTAFGSFGLAAICLISAMANEAPIFVGAAVSLAVMGVGFLAADQALGLLTDIRNALVPELAAPTVKTAAASETRSAEPQSSARTAAEIAADIRAMKARS